MDERIYRLVMSQPVPMRLADRLLLDVRCMAMTPTRWEILKLIARGWSNRAIADRLGMSYETVRSHVTLIYRRFDISGPATRTRLVVRLYREGIL